MNTGLWRDMLSDELLSSGDGVKMGTFPGLRPTHFGKIYIDSDSENDSKSYSEESPIELVAHRRSASYTGAHGFSSVPKLDLDFPAKSGNLLPSHFKEILFDCSDAESSNNNSGSSHNLNSAQKKSQSSPNGKKSAPGSPKKGTQTSPVNENFATIDGYDELLDKTDLDGATKLLTKVIAKVKDLKEQSRIYRSAADSNKKRLIHKEASNLYKKAEMADPTNAQNYLDHAKLLDEIGQADEAEQILLEGLQKTPISDQITVKLLKQFERRQHFNEARKVLGLIYKNSSNLPQQAAQSLAEGALFEVRHGKVEPALELLNHVEKNINIKSGYFIDLTESLKRRGYSKLSIQYAENGVEKFPSMPNNWNIYLNLQKSSDSVMKVLKNAKDHLSLTTVSKLEQTAAFLCAQYGNVKTCRHLIAECVAKATNEQRWRVLHNAALIELLYGDKSIVPLIFQNAAPKTPRKFISTLQLSFAKICEATDEISQAHHTYEDLYKTSSADWRVFLEYSMFLVRQNMFPKSLEVVKQGLQLHQNNGRLWALRVQLETNKSSQVAILKEAVLNAPKSGEVWTEAARICLNPLSEYFSMKSARFFLNTAFLFTPQYIDIFVEMIRLELLENGIASSPKHLDKVRELFLTGDGNYGTVVYLFRRPGFEFSDVEFNRIVEGVREDLIKHRKLYQRAIARTSFVIESIKTEEEKLRKSNLELKPNEFAFGLSDFISAITQKEVDDLKKSLILGSSGVLL
ncbi:hypothetical protein TRFO_13800 [Tritrichomonas foetus]|uniref:TPR Domain containing protein n=1 Tax=Tritrichomonas foetus TaxID=1144522 RepID=A0A1J4KWX6_9EUKA|nr:hypothetical protein TRFO_13800 [Tritrichomonas foetus]|eukprot:OHT15793.1 hypothetical protein TRFO_13800 [Tritrichomonas foetus]